MSWKISETESVSETEVDSCETTALNYGHRHKVGTMVHEYFCELNKVVGYVLSIAQDLKPGSPLVVALNITEDMFSFTELALDGDFSQLIETVVIRFEEFLRHPENLRKLITIVRKDLRIVTPVVKSVMKLTKSMKKFEDHVKHLFTYFQVDFKHILQKLENSVVVFSKKASSLFYGYLFNSAEEITGLFFEAVIWVETTADNLISYIRRKLFRYLAFFEEGIDILQAFFSGFSASGFSQTFIEALQFFKIFKKVRFEESSTNVMISDSSSQSFASGLALDE